MSKRCGALIGASLCLLFVSAFVPTVAAQTSSSNNYRLDESTVGQAGLPDSSSTNYKGAVSLGDLGVGNSSSANYNSQGGSQTSPDPNLIFSVNSSGINFPDFSASTPSMSTVTFSVINYTSYGYVVLVSGSPPTNNNHSIAAMASAGTSSPGFEQYGINLVANTSPQNIGANPNQGQFGFGVAASGYNTANNYKYVDGDTIASAPKSSGQTDFTITYLVNVGGLTPGGKYTTNQQLIVVGTY
jgi:hypothetical protein